eukprot:9431002-Pyramimonas_sp.AAC.1
MKCGHLLATSCRARARLRPFHLTNSEQNSGSEAHTLRMQIRDSGGRGMMVTTTSATTMMAMAMMRRTTTPTMAVMTR